LLPGPLLLLKVARKEGGGAVAQQLSKRKSMKNNKKRLSLITSAGKKTKLELEAVSALPGMGSFKSPFERKNLFSLKIL